MLSSTMSNIKDTRSFKINYCKYIFFTSKYYSKYSAIDTQDKECEIRSNSFTYSLEMNWSIVVYILC